MSLTFISDDRDNKALDQRKGKEFNIEIIEKEVVAVDTKKRSFYSLALLSYILFNSILVFFYKPDKAFIKRLH